jgi:LmbE family N-acetylglucosaminyl deacetylase
VVQTVLFPVPHQDDDLLSHPIRNYVGAVDGNGDPLYDVHTLLCTTGENSGIRPATMSKSVFTQARDDEQRRALRRAGVRFENIHIAPTRVPDGALTAVLAEQMIAQWLSEYGASAWVKVLTDKQMPSGVQQRHSDHVALGAGARSLYNAGGIAPNGLRFAIEPYFLALFQQYFPSINVGTEHSTNATVTKAALKEYQAADSLGFKFGFGWASVNEYFDQVYANTTSYWHAP